MKDASCRPFRASQMMSSPIIFWKGFLWTLYLIGEENQTLTANWSENEVHNPWRSPDVSIRELRNTNTDLKLTRLKTCSGQLCFAYRGHNYGTTLALKSRKLPP